VKLFLDANILFTAARTPSGKAALVIDCAGEGCWQIISSAYAVEEARRNLELKAPAALHRLKELLRFIEIVMPFPSTPCPASLPFKDRPIFQAAHAGGASHLSTGDLKDFGPLMNRPDLTSGIIIQTVADFLAAI